MRSVSSTGVSAGMDFSLATAERATGASGYGRGRGPRARDSPPVPACTRLDPQYIRSVAAGTSPSPGDVPGWQEPGQLGGGRRGGRAAPGDRQRGSPSSSRGTCSQMSGGSVRSGAKPARKLAPVGEDVGPAARSGPDADRAGCPQPFGGGDVRQRGHRGSVLPEPAGTAALAHLPFR